MPRSRNGLMAWAVTITKKNTLDKPGMGYCPIQRGRERGLKVVHVQILLHAVSVRAKEQGMLATIWVTSYVLNISSLNPQ